MVKNKTALGIAYLYTIVKFLFCILSGTSDLAEGVQFDIVMLFQIGYLWLCTTVVLIAVLYRQNKKQGRTLSGALKDGTIRKAVGAIIIADCMLALPMEIRSLCGYIAALDHSSTGSLFFGFTVPGLVIETIVFVGQLVLGIYLCTHKEKNPIEETEEGGFSSEALGIVLLIISITCVFELMSRTVSYIHSKSHPFEIWWLLIAACIVACLCIINRRKGNGFVSLFKDFTVISSTGLLLIVIGLLRLSYILPQKIMAYNSASELFRSGSTNGQYGSTVAETVLLFLIPILQLLFGIYLIHLSKNEAGKFPFSKD